MRLTLIAACLAATFSLSPAMAASETPLATGFPDNPPANSHAARILQAHEAASSTPISIARQVREAPLQLPFAGEGGSGILAFASPLAADKPDRGALAWGGAYAGISLGSTSFSSDTANSMYGHFSVSGSGKVAGLHAGHNWQRGDLVAGIEADFELGGQEGSTATGGGFTTNDERYHLREEWRASLRGRIGHTIGRGLVYATAGLAFAKIAQYYTEPGWAPTEDVHQILPGWTAGIGWEAPIANRWTFRAEYRLSGFAARTFQCDICGPADNDFTTSDIRAGISFRF